MKLKEERGRRAPAERPSRRDERRSDAEARAELKKRLRPYEREISALEARIAALTKEVEAVRASLADPALYDSGDKGERLKELTIAEARITGELAHAEEDWLHAQARLDALRREPAA
jgi:ATP-binding cassette subfamily F protein 3